MGGGRLVAYNLETNEERQLGPKCTSITYIISSSSTVTPMIEFQSDLSVSGDFALISNYTDNTLYNWKTGETLWKFKEGKSSYTVVLKNNIAITGTGANGDTRVRFWDITTKTKFAESERK